MKCDEFLNRLNDDSDLKDCRKHLESCPFCQEAYGADFEIESGLRKLAPRLPEADLVVALRRRIDGLQFRKKSLWKINKLVWAITIAATVAIAFVSAPLNLRFISRAASGMGAVFQMNYYSIHAETIWLNQSIEYLNGYRDQLLLIILAAAIAFFYILAQIKKPVSNILNFLNR